MIIEKRDGTLEQFNLSKIRNAISNVLEEKDINTVLTKIEKNLPKKDKVTVEEIQDIVEKTLMSLKFFEQGKSYILYRKQRENIRNSKTSLTKTFKEVLDADGSDISRENANVDGKAPMGLMLLFGSEIEKDYVKRYMISPKFTELHDSGDIHIHDLNMYACTFNCCNIGLKELFKKGFSTGHGTLRPPQSISTALTQAAIVVQANQNDMYGGQGIPLFDYELSPFIAKNLGSNIKNTIESVLGQEIDFNFKDFCYSLCEKNNSSLVDESLKELESKIYEFVGDKTKKVLELSRKRTFKDTFQACEGFVHNLNTLNSRCLPETEEVISLSIKSSRDIKKMSDIEKNALRKLIENLYKTRKISEVARELGVTERVMRKIMINLGIPRRSRKEASDFVSKRFKEQYGVGGPSGLPEIRQKIKDTQFRKFGCYAFNTEKQKQTMIERYGTENCMQNEQVKATMVKNNIKKYGYEHTFQVPEFREKARKTLLDKYGCENVLCAESPIRQKLDYSRTDEINRKMVDTKLEKNNGEYESRETKEKRRKTCLERYGFTTYPAFLHTVHTSKKQIEISEFIKQSFPELSVYLDIFGLLRQEPMLELDIWIPEIRLAIEYNGIYWHDRSAYNKDISENTIISKERRKDYFAFLNDITLIQIWEDDYLKNEQEVKNNLFNLICELKNIEETNNG